MANQRRAVFAFDTGGWEHVGCYIGYSMTLENEYGLDEFAEVIEEFRERVTKLLLKDLDPREKRRATETLRLSEGA